MEFQIYLWGRIKLITVDTETTNLQALQHLTDFEVRAILIQIMESSQMNEAFGHSLIGPNNFKLITEIIDAELRQLKIWFGMDRVVGAFASTLFSEKVYFILDIAGNFITKQNYLGGATICCNLLIFGSEIQLSSTEFDAEVSNMNSEIFRMLQEWEPEKIPADQYSQVMETLRHCGRSQSIEATGILNDFHISWSHLKQ
jgi:hypothetical protein